MYVDSMNDEGFEEIWRDRFYAAMYVRTMKDLEILREEFIRWTNFVKIQKYNNDQFVLPD